MDKEHQIPQEAIWWCNVFLDLIGIRRYLRRFPVWFCKRWRLLLKQMMCQWSGPTNYRRLMVFSLGFLLVLGSWQLSARPSLMQLMSYGHHKHLLGNLLESSGVLVFMGEARSLPREFQMILSSYFIRGLLNFLHILILESITIVICWGTFVVYCCW